MMDVTENQGSSEGDVSKAPSCSTEKQGPIGITPQTPQNEELMHQRVDDESTAKCRSEGVAATAAGTISAAGNNDPRDASESTVNDTSAKSPRTDKITQNISPNERESRLSSDIEHVDLEYSLGPLRPDWESRPIKRQRLQPDHQAGTSPTSREKYNLATESVADALSPQFWNDGASINKDNVPSRSFDVADDELVGGSSPISNAQSSPEDSHGGKRLSMGDEKKRNTNEAEEGTKTAIMAADVDEDEVETPKAGPSPSKVQTPKAEFQSANNDEVDFDKLSTMQSSHNNDHLDVRSDISSASSLVESFHEDEESRPFPPAPPSTPATAKEMFQPHPFQTDSNAGSLEYSIELNKSTDHPNPPTILATPGPPLMPENAFGDDIATPRPPGMSYSAATAETPRGGDETPDISGDVTERRQGQEEKKSHVKLARKTDFESWDVGDRYELKRILGRGSYGEVAQAVDRHAVVLQERALSQQQHSHQSNLPIYYRNSKYVAVKKISKAFDQEVDAVRLFREMHILRRLRGHECIIQLVDVVQPRSSDLSQFNDLYLVFEYVDTDLYKLIMSPQYLTTEHIQTFLYQMLVGLKYIHSSSGKLSTCLKSTAHALVLHFSYPASIFK